MLNITEIEQQYPPHLRQFKRHILREYMQYKILRSIFRSPYARQLSFLGGTALRIVYNNTRFSEDLDFDHFGLSEHDFQEIAQLVKRDLELEGYIVEMRHIAKGAYRCYMKFPRVLFDNQLSEKTEEKILIQIDSAPHHFVYTPDQKEINKFDIFAQIFVTPLDLLLAQKILAALERKRAKGRDFFDIVFLSARTKPSYAYLEEKIGTGEPQQVKERLLAHCRTLDFGDLAQDVQPFLFSPADTDRVEGFPSFLENVEW
ncbi:MAG: nucleotidyl transferase AbiEii/AbiGii toxin family protein [Candidatus Kerfeldbacteria bacterium]|nr:nucleotidyl transferase AbiEii/AbiGii toxin family protein [Candidatus Kerfeldbacteria bacterium]